MTYLNEDFDDGETFLSTIPYLLNQKENFDLACEWTHAHKGNMVNNGSKYIITGWLNIAI